MQNFSALRRFSPSLDYGRLGRRRRSLRNLRCLLLAVVAVLLFAYYAGYLGQQPTRKQAADHYATTGKSLKKPEPMGQEAVLSARPRYPQREIQAAGDIESRDLSKQLRLGKPNMLNRDVEFETALDRVVDLLPGEMEVRSLLHDIEGSGAEKLREIGLRARAYKRYLAAWEELHFVENSIDATFIRPDMVQYIRRYFTTGDRPEPYAGLERTIHNYEKYKAFMCKFGQLMASWTGPYHADHMSLHLNFKNGGRGIVLTAGSAHAPHLKTLVVSLRDVGCTLPIEIMYLDDSDLDVDIQSELESLDGVITREIGPMVNDKGWSLNGWAVKPFAIFLSSFREVVFIDADSLFFSNPELLFEDPGYVETGALFFKDRSMFPEAKKEWLKNLLPRPISSQVLESRFWRGESGHMQESGVVVVDKYRHFMAMLIVCRMNGPERNGNSELGTVGVYDMVYGDKETFWLGWELVGDTDYAFHGGRVAVLGESFIVGVKYDVLGELLPEDERHPPPPTKKSGPDATTGSADSNHTICSPQLLHLGRDGTPLWFNGGLFENKFLDKDQWKFGKFEQFIIEPETVAEGAWILGSHNKACLTGADELLHALSDGEQAMLRKMIGHARRFF